MKIDLQSFSGACADFNVSHRRNSAISVFVPAFQSRNNSLRHRIVFEFVLHFSTTRAAKSKMKNDHLPNLTSPYLSTGKKIDQSEDIILTTI
jgi:hypothetical protein